MASAILHQIGWYKNGRANTEELVQFAGQSSAHFLLAGQKCLQADFLDVATGLDGQIHEILRRYLRY
jgi:hypothetical protein